jgi:large subunit ribosomal protein L19e
MVDLRIQKRIASKLLKCGENRVWVDPDRIDIAATAVTREDVKKLISDGVMNARKKKGTSRARARKLKIQKEKGRRRGMGSRKGAKFARSPRKELWMKKIRAIRRYLKKLRNEGKIDPKVYRKFYLRASGGSFRSVSHLKTHLRSEGIDVKDDKGE